MLLLHELGALYTGKGTLQISSNLITKFLIVVLRSFANSLYVGFLRNFKRLFSPNAATAFNKHLAVELNV